PGVHLVDKFHMVGIALGALLVYSGFRMMRSQGEAVDPGNTRLVRLLRRSGRVTDEYDGSKFLTVRNGVLYMTPLFVVLATVELTDLVFAIDSIPAVLAISNDPFIVFSSNVFAVMGLRALYFVLSGMMREFRYLKVGLSLVLVFIGMKMMLVEYVRVPSLLALLVTVLLVGGSILASILLPAPAEAGEDRPS